MTVHIRKRKGVRVSLNSAGSVDSQQRNRLEDQILLPYSHLRRTSDPFSTYMKGSTLNGFF